MRKRLHGLLVLLVMGVCFGFSSGDAAFGADSRWVLGNNSAGVMDTALAASLGSMPPIEGAGLQANPYLITNEEQLMALAAGYFIHNYTSYYLLVNDIDLTTAEWTPIGGNGESVFSGVFDGNGYAIRNINLKDDRFTYAGLFGESTGTIKNLGVSASIDGAINAGALVGRNAGTIRQCYAVGTLAGRGQVGGLVGRNEKAVENSYSRADVTTTGTTTGSAAGGLIGYSDGAAVKYCYATGIVTGNTTGGLMGNLSANAIVAFNYYDRTTTSQGDTRKGAYSITTVEAKDKQTYTGWDFDKEWGISAERNDGYPYIIPQGERVITAIAGTGTAQHPYLITNEEQLIAIARGEVLNADSSYYVLQNDINLTARYWTPIGGNGQTVFNGVFDGGGHSIRNVTITQNNFIYAGLFGESSGTIKHLGVSANISGADKAGALMGRNTGFIQQCYSTGSVSGSGYVGGLAGRNDRFIEYCYSRADVTCTSTVSTDAAGGLIGYVFLGSVKYCYATGLVTGKTTGGLIGHGYGLHDLDLILYDYYDRTTSRQTDVTKGLGLTTEEMKVQASYDGWDFNALWSISPEINDGYPYPLVFLPGLSRAVTPAAHPPGGNVVSGTAVTLTTATVGAAIHYTVNGEIPTEASPVYFTPIAVTTDATIKAIAIKPGMANSGVGEFTYSVNNAATYTIIFDENGGDTAANPKSKMVSSAAAQMGILPTPPIRLGYVFAGWNSAADGSGISFTAATIVTRNITLYAQWVSASAETPMFSVASAAGKKGDTLTVSVVLTNNPGISSTQLKVSYDPAVLTVTAKESINRGEALSDLSFVGASASTYGNIPLTLSWAGVANDYSNGEIVKLTFKIVEHTPDGKYPITIAYVLASTVNQNNAQVAFIVQDGYIEVGSYLLGDVNGDGKVTLFDATYLMQYLNGWFDESVVLDTRAADVNKDGAITLYDATYLMQAMNGWFDLPGETSTP